MKPIILALILLSFPLHAKDDNIKRSGPPPLTGEQFDRYTRGKTLSYSANKKSYGSEEYRANRHVRWAFDDDTCVHGTWYEGSPAEICFLYEDRSNGAIGDPQCWAFFPTPNGLRAEFLSDTSDTKLYETETSDEPLTCLGPEVGV